MSLFSSFNITSLKSSISLFSNSNILFFLLFLVFVFLYGISVGKTKAVLSLLAIYVAFMLTELFPYFDALSGSIGTFIDGYYIKISLFFAFYLAVFSFLNISSLKSRFSSSEISIWQITLISIVQIGFMLAIIVSYVPVVSLPGFIKKINFVLGSETALFFWALLSLLVLLFVKASKKRSSSTN